MNENVLKRVQFTLLDICKEVVRVCDENDIVYYLDSGTLLGAVRHSGFIPWDDDLDISMPREDYNRFCKIAPKALSNDYYLQTWYNDKYYPLPFAKVRKRNTVYRESKANNLVSTGFWIDVFPLDNAPSTVDQQQILMSKLANTERCLLMKCRYQPWKENDRTSHLKRIAYLPYQALSCILSKESMINHYMTLVDDYAESDFVYLQFGAKKPYVFRSEWFGKGEYLQFEDASFRCPTAYKSYLSSLYGDYMTLPPIEKRYNRHQIYDIRF